MLSTETDTKYRRKEMVKYKIKERREKLGMSQSELIKKTGISRAQISALENGNEIDVRISTLSKVASALKCSVTSLFE